MNRRRLSLISLAVLVASAAAPAAALAGSGFTVPSRNTTCGILGKDKAGSGRPGLYCESRYVPGGVGESMGAAELGRTGKGRRISIGNDSSLYIGGWHEDGRYDKRPVLGYGKTWRRGGYRCVSRSSGLTCRRGSHGFFLSRESQRYF